MIDEPDDVALADGTPALALLSSSALPAPGRIVGGSLLAGVVLTIVSALIPFWSAGCWFVVGLDALAAALGVALLAGATPEGARWPLLSGLVLLDLMPIALALSGAGPTVARAWLVWLMVPTVVCAALFTDRTVQLVQRLAMVLAALATISRPVAGEPWVRTLVVLVGVSIVLLVQATLVDDLARDAHVGVAELRRLALTDGLTGLLNRRGLAAAYRDLLRRAGRREGTIGALILDIDHFKKVNDRYGHAAGDAIIQRVCQVLLACSDGLGPVARLGGEELAALSIGPIEPVAQAVRAALTQIDPRVTVSIGLVEAPLADVSGPDGLWNLLQGADDALYEAKNTGRDRITRGVLATGAVDPTRASTPTTAAVPRRPLMTGRNHRALFGWALLGIGVTGMITALATTGSLGAPRWVELILSLATGLIALWLIAAPPSVSPVTGGVVLLVLDTLTALLTGLPEWVRQTAGVRPVAGLVLLLFGVVAALHLPRALVIAQEVITVGVLALLNPGVPGLTVLRQLVTGVIIVGCVELIYRLRHDLDRSTQELHVWSVTDPLTKLANRRGLAQAFDHLTRSWGISVLVLDVDDFKQVNDRHGHAVGDDTLVRLADTLRTVSGTGTVVGRTGGDEFAVLVPGRHTTTLANRIRTGAALLPVPVTVTIGTAVAEPYRPASLGELITRADTELIRAKQRRRIAAGAIGDVADGAADAELDDLVDETTLPSRPALRLVADGEPRIPAGTDWPAGTGDWATESGGLLRADGER